jgi:TRAP-type C4-dicarboxylate transport system substrate-binding protein
MSVVLARFAWGYDMKLAEREVQKYLTLSAHQYSVVPLLVSSFG